MVDRFARRHVVNVICCDWRADCGSSGVALRRIRYLLGELSMFYDRCEYRDRDRQQYQLERGWVVLFAISAEVQKVLLDQSFVIHYWARLHTCGVTS